MIETAGRLAALLLCALLAACQVHRADKGLSHEALRQLATRNWVDVKIPRMAPGARMALLEGNLREAGPVVFDLFLPAGYVLQAHYHDTDEELTALSGTVMIGGMKGEPLDRAVSHRLEAGDVHKLPARTPHWAMIGEESVIVRVRTTGPYTIRWVDEAKP